MIDLDAIKARLEAVTPGPWEHDRNGQVDDAAGLGTVAACSWLADAALIAHAPTDLAALVAEVERLRAEAADLKCEGADLIDSQRIRAELAEQEVERLRAVVSALPRACDRCRNSGKWDGSITHCQCGGRLA